MGFDGWELIVCIVSLLFALILIFRPWWFEPGGDPLSCWIRQRRREKYANKYK